MSLSGKVRKLCPGKDVETIQSVIEEYPLDPRYNRDKVGTPGFVNMRCCTPYRWTCLHLAAAGHHTDVLTLLLNAGAVVDAKSVKKSYTALHVAAMADQAKAISILLDWGATIDYAATWEHNKTPLTLAIEQKSIDATKELISRGASLKKARELESSKYRPFQRGMRNESIQLAIAKGISSGKRKRDRERERDRERDCEGTIPSHFENIVPIPSRPAG